MIHIGVRMRYFPDFLLCSDERLAMQRQSRCSAAGSVGAAAFSFLENTILTKKKAMADVEHSKRMLITSAITY